MKTDKELESVLDICSVQFHLVLSIKRYMTSYIVIWRHFKWRQRWATFRFWAGSAPGLCRCSCCMWHVRIYIRSINTLAKNTFCLKRKNIFEEQFSLLSWNREENNVRIGRLKQDKVNLICHHLHYIYVCWSSLKESKSNKEDSWKRLYICLSTVTTW